MGAVPVLVGIDDTLALVPKAVKAAIPQKQSGDGGANVREYG